LLSKTNYLLVKHTEDKCIKQSTGINNKNNITYKNVVNWTEAGTECFKASSDALGGEYKEPRQY